MRFTFSETKVTFLSDSGSLASAGPEGGRDGGQGEERGEATQGAHYPSGIGGEGRGLIPAGRAVDDRPHDRRASGVRTAGLTVVVLAALAGAFIALGAIFATTTTVSGGADRDGRRRLLVRLAAADG